MYPSGQKADFLAPAIRTFLECKKKKTIEDCMFPYVCMLVHM